MDIRVEQVAADATYPLRNRVLRPYLTLAEMRPQPTSANRMRRLVTKGLVMNIPGVSTAGKYSRSPLCKGLRHFSALR